MVVIIFWRIRVTRPLSINMLESCEERAILAYTVAFCVNFGYLRGSHSSEGICIRVCVSERRIRRLCIIFIFFLKLCFYHVRGLFIGLVSVEAVGLKGRRKNKRSYRESSSALTINEF
jgi:hypothetical protein